MTLLEIPMVATSLVGVCFLAGLDAPPARADFTFGEPVNIQSAFPLLDPGNDIFDCFSADGLEMYFESSRSGGHGQWDLWVCKRASPQDDWGPPENLGPLVNSAGIDEAASISADGLELYFDSSRAGGHGSGDIYVTRRPTRNNPWGPATNLGTPVNTPYYEFTPSVSSDGLELYFGSTRPGGYGGWDLYVSKRATRNEPWDDPVNLGPAVNGPAHETAPCLSPDGRLLLFESNRPGGYGSLYSDAWMTRRTSRSAPWGTPVNLGPKINGPAEEYLPRFAADGSALYFALVHDGPFTTWKAPILPIVDFSGDGMVDIKDLLRLIESWGRNDPVVDTAPLPSGDGKVDEKDLEVLMSYWGQEVNDPTLVAHWKLNEAAGTIAIDSAGSYAGTLHGNPLWQPTGGKKGGALQFDGVDDYISTGKVLDPSTGPFSVFAWVKGGAPGQVIASQEQGLNWLGADGATGALRTDLRQPAPNARKPAGPSLISSAVITDGNWHRVGFVWDGAQRILYVDDVEVLGDTVAGLEPAAGGLRLGVDSKLTRGTFWSGLIDDVRIYDRAVRP